MKRWLEEEQKYFIKNYSTRLDREISKKINRSLKSISYMACKLHLKKDRDFYNKSRKRLLFEIEKELLERLYLKEEKSIREISKELKVGKTTIEYYIHKYCILPRNRSLALRLNYSKNKNWIFGLKKDTDKRVKILSQKIKSAYDYKKTRKYLSLEEKFQKPLKEIIYYFYWEKRQNQGQIAKALKIGRAEIIKLMKQFGISKRPKFEYISSLKKEKHSHYGKSWEQFFGLEKAKELRKKNSISARKSIIFRLKNNKIPTSDTSIERLLASEMTKRGITFVRQFDIDNRFVCDFAIPSAKLIIECDGDYWHANPKLYNLRSLHQKQKQNIFRDRLKDEYLTKNGWKVIRFYESDLKSDIANCGEEVEEELKKVKSPIDQLMGKSKEL